MDASIHWIPDMLEAPYECTTLDLGEDEEGAVVATLVRRKSPQSTHKAVLYIHGFCDYFFQKEMADQYVARDIDFYALDLRKCGRSIRPHQTPNFTTNIEEYFEELNLALRIICEIEQHDRLLIGAHSTGGLVAAHFVNTGRPTVYPIAIFFNSPFFEFNDNWFTREILLDVIGAVGRRHPSSPVPGALSPFYGESLHKGHRGSWEFDTQYKPIEGFPIRAGWVRAIHNAHKRLQAGLDIRCPVLVMHSGESTKAKEWSERLRSTDAVLDVDDIRRYADCLGDHVTKIRINGGVHDLVLSKKEIRDKVYRELFLWLEAYYR